MTHTCQVCHREFTGKPKLKYCSPPCRSAGQSGAWVQKRAAEARRHAARRKPTPEQRARLMLEYVLEGLSENRTVR